MRTDQLTGELDAALDAIGRRIALHVQTNPAWVLSMPALYREVALRAGYRGQLLRAEQRAGQLAHEQRQHERAAKPRVRYPTTTDTPAAGSYR